MAFSFKAHLILILYSKSRFSRIVEAIFSRSAKVIMHPVSVTTITGFSRKCYSCVRHTLGAAFAVSIRVISKHETEAAAPSSSTIDAARLMGSIVDWSLRPSQIVLCSPPPMSLCSPLSTLLCLHSSTPFCLPPLTLLCPLLPRLLCPPPPMSLCPFFVEIALSPCVNVAMSFFVRDRSIPRNSVDWKRALRGLANVPRENQ